MRLRYDKRQLIERLRAIAEGSLMRKTGDTRNTILEAADQLATLTEERDRLRGVVEITAPAAHSYEPLRDHADPNAQGWVLMPFDTCVNDTCATARALLSDPSGGGA